MKEEIDRSISFATSNSHKFREVELVLRRLGVGVRRLRGKGLEIQSDDIVEVARFASADASKKYERPLIVEDTGLFIDALGGFPGPYASFVFRSIGSEAILRLLGGKGKEEEKRRATFRSAVAYCEPAGVPMVFRGSIVGAIAKRAAGRGGFGFDPIFIPAGHRHTMAQLSIDEKCRISHRAEAVTKFGEWYVRLVGNVYQPNFNDSQRADGRRHGFIRTGTGSRT